VGVLEGRRKRLVKMGRGIRPTASRVKGAIFNMVPPELLQEGRVLDGYAGTGALGLEALGRGARWADFIERDPRLCKGIQESLKKAGLEKEARVHCTSVSKALTFLAEPYDVVLLDPPYALGGIDAIMARIGEVGLLRSGALLVLEHSWQRPPPDGAGALELVKRRRYGDTAVSIYAEGGEGSGVDE